MIEINLCYYTIMYIIAETYLCYYIHNYDWKQGWKLNSTTVHRNNIFWISPQND